MNEDEIFIHSLAIADILQIAPRTADSLWAYARAWLAVEIARSRQT